MNNNIFALVDCNNFYVSCERALQPRLLTCPVVVLSNNDGCIVARSNEVKALGVPMGAPIFKWRSQLDKQNTRILSSNYSLYDDLSGRVMSILEEYTPELEIYSIDEAFLFFRFAGEKVNLVELGKEIRRSVYRQTGVPVSVGFAPSKTLAKAAAEIAKKNPAFKGVVAFSSTENIDLLLRQIPVVDVWGVGRRYHTKLSLYRINTAYDLKYASRKLIRQLMTVMGERTVLELNGVSCYPLSTNYFRKKNIAYTRSFGTYQESLQSLSEAVAEYAAGAAAKLRAQASLTRLIQIFILTNNHNLNHPQYHNSILIKLTEATDSSPQMIKAAKFGLEQIFRSGYKYKKAGVIFHHLIPRENIQHSFFHSNENNRNLNPTAMPVLDTINRRWGKNTLKFAAQGLNSPWTMRQQIKSPRYTTAWEELPTVTI